MSRAALSGWILAWGLCVQFMQTSVAIPGAAAVPAPCVECEDQLVASAPPMAARRSCGAEHFAPEVVDAIERRVSRDRTAARRPMPAPAVIRIALHVIHSGGAGLLDQGEINAQMDILNASYNNVQFVLDSVDYTDNAQWFTQLNTSSVEKECKKALQRDPTKFLNVYTSNLGPSLFGFSTFPWDLKRQPELDGVVIHYGTLPGGPLQPFNQGITLVHETGHWCGLYHTFQGGCSARNDQVADTPAEQSPTSGCPNNKDTCKSKGSDPIHNYMDYSDDRCLNQFTAGQYTRMTKVLGIYRSALATP